MTQVIYIDVLIAVNLFINYFMLTATAKFLYIKTTKLKIIVGSSLGAIYSLYMLLPPHNFVVSLAIKLIMSSTIVWVSLCNPKSSIYLKALLCFYSINFAFLGSMFAMWCFFEPRGMYMKNNVVYFNVSPIILLVSTVVSYFIIETVNKIVGGSKNETTFCEIEIKLLGKIFCVTAKIDTGNTLRETFSGLPVVVVCRSVIKEIVPEVAFSISDIYREKNDLDKVYYDVGNKMRLIPFSAISGNGILPAFKSEYIIVKNINVKREAYIAICPDNTLKDEFTALIGPELIE